MLRSGVELIETPRSCTTAKGFTQFVICSHNTPFSWAVAGGRWTTTLNSQPACLPSPTGPPPLFFLLLLLRGCLSRRLIGLQCASLCTLTPSVLGGCFLLPPALLPWPTDESRRSRAAKLPARSQPTGGRASTSLSVSRVHHRRGGRQKGRARRRA